MGFCIKILYHKKQKVTSGAIIQPLDASVRSGLVPVKGIS